jgi:hypothetical protein
MRSAIAPGASSFTASGPGPPRRRSGLVRYDERGTRNVYRLDPAGLGELRAWLDTFWEIALDHYAARVRDDSDGRSAGELKESPDA